MASPRAACISALERLFLRSGFGPSSVDDVSEGSESIKLSSLPGAIISTIGSRTCSTAPPNAGAFIFGIPRGIIVSPFVWRYLTHVGDLLE